MQTRSRLLIILGGLCLPVVIAGCQSVNREAAFADIQSDVSRRLNKDLRWSRNAGGPVTEAPPDRLAKELTVNDAVQFALLNNRNLQAVFEDIGIAQADLMQAGRIQNPRLNGSFELPVTAVAPSTAAIGLAQNFLDIIFVPMRKKLAAALFEAAKARVTVEALRLASKTQRAYYELQSAQQLLEMRQSIGNAAEASAYATEQLRKAGNITLLDLNRERDQSDQAKLDLSQAEAAIVERRESLNQLMGLWGPEAASWKIPARLPELPTEELDLANVEKAAIENSAVLEASRREVVAFARQVGYTNISATISNLEIGGSAARDDDKVWRAGPSMSLELPIFDQGGARRSKAQAEVRKALELHAALAVDLRSNARIAVARLNQARSQSLFLRDQVLPRRQAILDETQKQYNGMQLGVFELLTAKRDQIEGGRQYIERLRDYWVERSEIESISAGFSEVNREFAPANKP